ncbi:retinol dehydrogenase 11-like isoform X1 [Leptidea sinapis]|uniref:retinol dehydrogenase 11-like isoform X1 n=1 Tax=Leptidea sinapis TaxID=189913 RepID=UPI002143DD7B|nr:retinol dehydrogenase 11-like isoform X1 [Leptidea sinapis]
MFVVLYVISMVIITAIIVGFYQKATNAICKSKKNLTGRTAIVTGGTNGMGLRIATDFASRGARVIVACPFIDEGTQGRNVIVDKTGNSDVVFKMLDLASLASVRSFAKEILETEDRLDILINNAGVGVGVDRLTKDGLNFIMQVNYFGHFLLTLLLLPLLLKTGTPSEPARVVNTSSILHNIGIINFDQMNSLKYWYTIQLYGNSKLCLILFAHELAKKLKGKNVVINTVDPGAVGTGIFNCVGSFFGVLISYFFKNFYKTPWEGAQTAIHVALDNKAGKVSGEFFKNCELTRARSAAYNDRLSAKLWDESVRCVKLDSAEVKECLTPRL